MNFDVIRALSTISERIGLARRAGMTFDGNRDMYRVLGYKTELTPNDYRARFERDAVAARVVEAYPLDTWRGSTEIYDDPSPEVTTSFEKACDALVKRLSLWDYFQRLDILAGLGEYAVLLIGGPGDFDKPLVNVRRPEDIAYLAVSAQEDAPMSDYDLDKRSPRYGRPRFYTLKQISGPDAPQVVPGRVHYSRILPFADGILDTPMRGTPRLKRVWNRLDDLEKVVGGGSEAFWLRAHQGYHFNLDKDFRWPADPTQKQQAQEQMNDEIDDFVNKLSRVIRSKGMDVDTLGSDVAEFSGQASTILTIISLATGIPKRILEGSERGELSSNQDKTTWDQKIADRRAMVAEPRIIHPFFRLMIELGALPRPKWDRFWVSWSKARDLDETTRARLANQWAATNKQMNETVVTRDEIRVEVLGLPPILEVVTQDDLDTMNEKFKKIPAKTGPAPDEDPDQADKAETQDGLPVKTPDGTSSRA